MSILTNTIQFLFIGIGTLPLTVRRIIGSLAGRLVGCFPSRDRTISELQLTKIGRMKSTISREVYRNLGRVFLESLNFQPMLSDRSLLDSSPIADYWNARKSNRGLIALSAHIGNWELLAATAASLNIPLSVIGREARKRSWQGVLQANRARAGVQVIWRSDARGVKSILSALKNGEVVAALIDQDTDVRSVPSVFMEHNASTPVGIVELGIRNQSDFVSVFSFRDEKGCYCFSLRQIVVPEHDPITSILHQYHTHLEELVRSYPSQWAWVHKRWRTRADSKRLSSKEYIQHLESIS